MDVFRFVSARRALRADIGISPDYYNQSRQDGVQDIPGIDLDGQVIERFDDKRVGEQDGETAKVADGVQKSRAWRRF